MIDNIRRFELKLIRSLNGQIEKDMFRSKIKAVLNRQRWYVLEKP